MATFTKSAIKSAFLELLNDRPLSNITVKDIVTKCGINRNSFYYHFHDMPELIEEIIKEESEKIIECYPSVTSIVECFDALIEFISHQERAIMHIYRSVNREVFERYLMETCEYFIVNYVNTALSNENIEEADKKTIINYYKSVCFGLVLEWLNSGMKDEFIKDIRRIFLLKADWAGEIARLLKGQI